MADDSAPTVRQRSKSKNGKDPQTEDNAPTQTATTPSRESPSLFADMNPKWKNWWIRGLFTFVMIASFLFIIYLGVKAMVVMIICIQVKCYHEVISVGHQHYKKYNLPWFRTLSWYFLGSTNYFFYGEFAADYFSNFGEISTILLKNHRLISFSLYTIGIMMFVLSLRKNYYKVQFALIGWYQLTLMIILFPSYLFIQNLLTGLIWFFLPVSMVICNDIFAYVFGFFFGKTQLIKLSPKKTWEGFLGGALATALFGQVLCEIMSQNKYFFCPAQLNMTTYKFSMECSPSPTFQLQPFLTLHPAVQKGITASPSLLVDALLSLLGVFGVHVIKGEVWMYPMILHGIVLSFFSSLIAPFGGFFASGFKRAFKIKDFSDTIPGHGGIMDRFDCQILMSMFVNVYINSVVRAYNPNKLMHQVMFLEPEQQVHFYNKLKDMLQGQGLI